MADDVLVLNVVLHGQTVGTITRTAGDNTGFAFNSQYLSDGERVTLGLSFTDAHENLRTRFKNYQTRLMPYFSNLLPEGELRRYLAERGGVHEDREFFLLWLLGQDLPGALRVEAADGAGLPPAYAREAGLEQDGQRESGPGEVLRFSLAGVQLKFSAISQPSNRLTIPARGVGGNWILKLPSARFTGVPKNEFSMMTLAGKVGISVPRVRLIDLNEVRGLPPGIGTMREPEALAIERFDHWPDGKQVHMEDFAQVFELYPQKKYRPSSMNIANVLGLKTPEEDVVEFVRRLVFGALIGNADMHAKNWSLIYPDGRNARLSPAYDLLSTTAYLPDESAALKVSRTRRYSELTLDELAHLANRASLPERLVLQTARETVERFRDIWPRERIHLPMPEDVSQAIERQLKVLPLAQ